MFYLTCCMVPSCSMICNVMGQLVLNIRVSGKNAALYENVQYLFFQASV